MFVSVYMFYTSIKSLEIKQKIITSIILNPLIASDRNPVLNNLRKKFTLMVGNSQGTAGFREIWAIWLCTDFEALNLLIFFCLLCPGSQMLSGLNGVKWCPGLTCLLSLSLTRSLYISISQTVCLLLADQMAVSGLIFISHELKYFGLERLCILIFN